MHRARSASQDRIDEIARLTALWTESSDDAATNAYVTADASTAASMRVSAPDDDDAFAERVAFFTSASQWESLIELHLSRLGRLAPLESPEAASARAAALRDIASVFETKLDDPDQALDALTNALAEDLHDKETARALERLAHATGRWNEVIETASNWLKVRAPFAKNPEIAAEQLRILLYLAKWYGDDLGRPELAQPYYVQITLLDPNNVDAMRQLACLYRKAGNWSQTGTTLLRALEVAITDVERKEVMTDLGELLDVHMQETDQALAYFKQAVLIDPRYAPALEHLDRIYSARGLGKELADVLEMKARAVVDRAEAASARLRAAELHETRLGDAARAADLYRQVTEADPGNLQALRGLARTYEALEKWADLVRVLEAQLDAAATDRERIEILMVLATIQEEHFLKADAAAVRLEQVLAIDPNDEDAYAALEHNLEKRHQWHALVATYERHIAATVERPAKIRLYGSIATIYAEQIGDAERALAAYQRIVDLDPHDRTALEALAKLAEKMGDTAKAVAYMASAATHTSDPKQRADALYKIGKSLDERLADRLGAERRYEQALDVDPSHLPSLAALRQIALDKGDFDKAAHWLDLEQSHTPALRHRAKLLVELARLRGEMLSDHTSAILTFEAAHQDDPDNEDAALPLAEEYLARRDWPKAEPLFEMLARKSARRERAEQHALHKKLGRTCAALGKNEKALKAFTAAHQLDTTDLETTFGLAEIRFRLEDWSGALSSFQKLLTQLEESDVERRAKTYYKLGAIKREQGQLKQAIHFFEKALALDGNYRPTLDALVSLYSDVRDWKSVVAYQRHVLDLTDAPAERLALLHEIAAVWADKEKNPSKAADALEEARELAPYDAALVHRLIALHQETECWPRLRNALRAAADLEKDHARRSKILFTIAQIHRDKEHDPDQALALFDEALDANPMLLEAFERIDKILTAKRDWKSLERAYRKMLLRLSAAKLEGAELEYNLWHSLGLIYRDRLQDTASAIECFKMAARFKPDEMAERQILAELHGLANDYDGALGEHAIILQKEPLCVHSYRSMAQLHAKRDAYDRAWCACAVLEFLGHADNDERAYFKEHRPRGLIEPRSRLDNDQWLRNVFHKDEDIYVGKIMEMITPAAIVAKTTQLRDAKQLPVLEAHHKQDPAAGTNPFASIFGWAAQVLGLPTPDLYVRPDVAGALAAAPSLPPASVAGRSVLEGFSPAELSFIVGKHLAYYRGEHYIRTLCPTLAELKVLFFAALQLVTPDFAVPPELAPAVAATGANLAKHMLPIQREGLRLVVQKFVADGATADLKRWMQTTELTACRAGLLLCGDLEVARKIIAAEPQLPGDLAPQEKMKELILFSVSEQYAQLRRAIRIGVGNA